MAITKIHPVRNTKAAVNYIIDKDKTDGEIYVSSYACAAQTADIEFEETASMGSGLGNVNAQHLIQSFKPGEVDAVTAHEIGNRLAMELTGGKHEFVLATHVDKDHIHNHIVFNQVSFVDYKKFRMNKNSFNKMQDISDRLCASYGLSVIEKSGHKGKDYIEYKNISTHNSNRQMLKNTIDSFIPFVENVDELFKMLNVLGYEIKETNGNYSLKKEGSERFMRLNSLGEKYSFDAIVTRIKHKDLNATPLILHQNKDIGLLKDLSKEIAVIKNPAYLNKVAITQVKILAQTYSFLNTHGITSASMIKDKQAEWALNVKELRATIRDMESRMDELKTVYEALLDREKYNDVYSAYIKSGKSNAFFDEHTAELKLFGAACKKLTEHHVSPNSKSDEIRAQFESLKKERDAQLDKYHSVANNLKQLNTAAKNIDILLSTERNHKKHDKELSL